MYSWNLGYVSKYVILLIFQKFYERIPILRRAKIIEGVKKIAIQFIRVRLVTVCEGIQTLIEGH